MQIVWLMTGQYNCNASVVQHSNIINDDGIIIEVKWRATFFI
jgi:hypothetical protein